MGFVRYQLGNIFIARITIPQISDLKNKESYEYSDDEEKELFTRINTQINDECERIDQINLKATSPKFYQRLTSDFGQKPKTGQAKKLRIRLNKRTADMYSKTARCKLRKGNRNYSCTFC